MKSRVELRISISCKFPGDADAADPGNTLKEVELFNENISLDQAFAYLRIGWLSVLPVFSPQISLCALSYYLSRLCVCYWCYCRHTSYTLPGMPTSCFPSLSVFAHPYLTQILPYSALAIHCSRKPFLTSCRRTCSFLICSWNGLLVHFYLLNFRLSSCSCYVYDLYALLRCGLADGQCGTVV